MLTPGTLKHDSINLASGSRFRDRDRDGRVTATTTYRCIFSSPRYQARWSVDYSGDSSGTGSANSCYCDEERMGHPTQTKAGAEGCN